MYFCVLEALQNVAKYANASGARISLAESNGDLTFLVEDDGVGFDPSRARGAGLANMRDRMEALGGDVVIRSSAGAGTMVRGRVPVPPQGDAALLRRRSPRGTILGVGSLGRRIRETHGGARRGCAGVPLRHALWYVRPPKHPTVAEAPTGDPGRCGCSTAVRPRESA